MIDGVALNLFRGNVAGSADDLSGASNADHCYGFERFGQTKVRDVKMVRRVDEDILRLEIAMDDLGFMRRQNPRRQLFGKRRTRSKGSAPCLMIPQVLRLR